MSEEGQKNCNLDVTFGGDCNRIWVLLFLISPTRRFHFDEKRILVFNYFHGLLIIHFLLDKILLYMMSSLFNIYVLYLTSFKPPLSFYVCCQHSFFWTKQTSLFSQLLFWYTTIPYIPNMPFCIPTAIPRLATEWIQWVFLYCVFSGWWDLIS